MRILTAVLGFAPTPSLRRPALRKSLRRWRIGHQLFIVLDQMLLASVAVLDRALIECDWATAEKGFDRVAQLFFASSAALRHTGDFAPVRTSGWLFPTW